MQFKCGEIARAVGGRLSGDPEVLVSGFVIDSRRADGGECFIALKGEKADGHEFLNGLTGTISAAIVSRPLTLQFPQIVVDDTLTALQALARFAHQRMRGRFIAVTGSVGKTTTKELLKHALAEKGRTVVATPGNFNSTIGVPLSLCNFPESFTFAVVEMGMNQPEELDLLGSIVPPDILVYTAIRPVHTEFFPSLEAVADAKGELLSHLKDGGTLLYDAGDPQLRRLAERWSGRSITFGVEDGEFSAEVVENRGFLGAKLLLQYQGREWKLQIPEGNLNVNNILAALGVCLALEMDLHGALERIERFSPVEHRGEIVRTERGVTLVDDCYNASPSAVREALRKYAVTPVEGKRIFVFGDMLELGEIERDEHLRIGEEAAGMVDLMVSVGPLAKLAGETVERSGSEFHHFESSDEAGRWVSKRTRQDDWVLIKGSRSMELERVVEALEAAA